MANAKQRLTAMGYPTSVAELEALKPPEDQNAAAFYLPLIADFEKSKLSRMPTAAATKDQFVKASDADIALLDRMDRLNLRPKLWFNCDYDQGQSVSIDHLPTIRRMAMALAKRATLDAHRGNPKRALERLKTVSTIARHLRSDPTIYGGYLAATLTSDRNMAIIEMGKGSADLPFLRALKKEVELQSPPLQVKDYIGASAVAFANPPKDWAPQDWESFLLTQPAMLKRMQAHNLEMLVHIGNAAKDGLTETEAAGLRDLESRTFFQNFRFLSRKFGDIALIHPDARANAVPVRHVLLSLDFLIEKAGGPKMSKPSDVRMDVQPNGWIVRDKSGDLMSFDSRTWFVHASYP